MNEPQPYRDRRTWCLDLRKHRHHEVKIYAISASGKDLEGSWIEAAWSRAREHFPEPRNEKPSHGFLILHQGTEALWLLIYHWIDDILYQELLRAPLESPTDFSPAGFSAACAWELEVVTHERDAWVRYVLAKPSAPDFRGYLEDQLRIDPRD